MNLVNESEKKMQKAVEEAKKKVLSIYPEARMMFHHNPYLGLDSYVYRVAGHGTYLRIWDSSSHWDNSEDEAWINSSVHIEQRFIRRLSE